MKKKSLLVICLVMALVLSLVGACAKPAPPAPAPVPAPAPAPVPAPPALPEVTWNLQGMQPHLTTLPMPQFVDVAKRVEERTNGKFTIQVAVEGELGIHRDALNEALASGILELCSLPSSTAEMTMPHTGIYHVSQLAVTPEEWDKVLEALEEMDQAEMKKHGFQLVSPGACFAVWNQEMYIKEPADLTDLDGLKVRVWQASQESLISALNGEPVYMALPEVYMAMQRGVVDGLITGPPMATSMSLFEVASQFYPIGHPGGMKYFVVNTKAFEALPDEYKTILVEEAGKWSEAARKGVAGEVKKALGALEEEGMQMNELTPAEREAWRAAALALWDEFVKVGPLNAEAMAIAKKTLGLD